MTGARTGTDDRSRFHTGGPSVEAATDEELVLTAETFQILANTTRLRIAETLAREEMCVTDLASMVQCSESAVSHHLRQLRLLRLVRTRRDGRTVYYRLDDDHVATLLAIGLEHVRESLG
jgi:DNA-binding transcriptional ArsR family regulator